MACSKVKFPFLLTSFLHKPFPKKDFWNQLCVDLVTIEKRLGPVGP